MSINNRNKLVLSDIIAFAFLELLAKNLKNDQFLLGLEKHTILLRR